LLSTNSKDLFFNKSKSWDLKSRRVQSAKKIAEAIAKNINLDKGMHILRLWSRNRAFELFYI